MRETWNLCYVGSVNAGDFELLLCGFRKCERLGTCVMWVPQMRETWNLCYVGSVNAGDLKLVLCGFRKCGRLGTCVMWFP